MNFGFNSNVRVGGALYHVQTEDRGPSHPYLDTVVYEAGRVVYKKSSSYSEFVAKASKVSDLAGQLHERLAQQHRDVIAQLEAGTLSLRGQDKSNPEALVEDAGEGLLVRLENPKTWLKDGMATLAVGLRRRTSGQSVAGAEIEALIERGKERVHCKHEQTDDCGLATLEFPMPAMASEGASLLIRATDGGFYGELRFMLKVKQSPPVFSPVQE